MPCVVPYSTPCILFPTTWQAERKAQWVLKSAPAPPNAPLPQHAPRPLTHIRAGLLNMERQSLPTHRIEGRSISLSPNFPDSSHTQTHPMPHMDIWSHLISKLKKRKDLAYWRIGLLPCICSICTLAVSYLLINFFLATSFYPAPSTFCVFCNTHKAQHSVIKTFYKLAVLRCVEIRKFGVGIQGYNV